MKILLIDNNQEDRERIKQGFQKEFYGLEFLEVTSREGFEKATARGDFDVALTDYFLNWTDGLWILRTIKERFSCIPVIMVTDTGNEEIAVEGMKSGLSDYILKRQMHRLPVAVKKGLKKAGSDKDRNEANKQAKASEEYCPVVPGPISDYAYTFRVEPDNTLLYECVTESFTPITGYILEEANARNGWLSLIYPDDMTIFVQHRNRLFSGQSNISEFRIITKNGEVLWLRDYAQPVWGEAQGRVIHIYGTAQNITELKQHAETLRDTEAKYQKLIETASDAIFIADAETGIIIDTNKRAEDLLGYLREEIVGMHQTQLHPQEEAMQYMKIFGDHAREGNVFTKGLYVRHKNGHRVPVEISVSVTFLGNKKVVQGIYRDIAESAKVNEELEIFKMLFSEIRDLAYICDTKGNILYVNKIFEKFTGHKPEEFFGKSFAPLFNEENLANATDAHARSVKGERLQFELCFKDTGIVCEYRNFHLRDEKGNIVRTIGIARDVTEHKQAEKDLHESHERLTSILDSLNAVVYVADMKTYEIIYANKCLQDLSGNVTGKICWQTLQTKQVSPCNFCTNDKLLDSGGKPTGIYSWEFQNTVNGRWYTISDRAITWVDGRIVRLEIATDITARKHVEEALHETNQTLHALIHASPLAIIAFNTDGNVTMWNPAAEHMFGWKEQEVLGHPLPIVPKDKQEECRALSERVLRGESFTGVEVRRQKKDGSSIDISLSKAMLRNGQSNKNGIMCVVADITGHKRTQAIDVLLHDIDQFVLQGRAPDFILPYVCTHLTDIFSYPLVWIGTKEADGAVSVSAQAGTHVDYLADFRVRWDNTPEGECLMGIAIRSGKTQASDIQEPVFRRCQERAYRYGLQSFIVVPLSAQDKVLGTLNLYTLVSNAFEAETVRLLENLAARISVTLLMATDQQQLRLHSAAMASVANAVFITDYEGHIKWINEAFVRLSGYTREEVYGQTPRLFKSGKHNTSFYQLMWQAILAGKIWRGEIVNRHKGGSFYIVNQTITPLLDTRNKTCHFVAIHEDITDKKEAEERIIYMAHYDTLTNLPNRILFRDRLQQEMVHAHRDKRLVAVMFLDLDRFKIINDTLGHAFGDLLLKALAERLRVCVREGDTVSRLGGDEFTFVIPDIAHPQDAALLAQKILSVTSSSFQIEGHEVHTTSSIGIAMYPLDADNMDGLIKKADIAMYHAKEHGGSAFRFYMEAMNIHSLERLTLENDLRKALDKGELLVYYQPQVDQNTGQIISMEALARWQHPDQGMIYPARFIPIAEETGLIVPIGEWVLMTACTQTRAWHDAGFSTLRVTVNLSVRQFKQHNLTNIITRVLQESGLDPHYLELEITEGIIMQNDVAILATLRELKALGILFSIDDFGTEYSSLSYLKRFPIDTLKIDRSFVQDITTNPDDAAIVTAIIAIAKSLKLKVVAEGVENKEQAAFLRELHCTKIQGYLYSHPLPAIDMEHLLQKNSIQNIKNK